MILERSAYALVPYQSQLPHCVLLQCLVFEAEEKKEKRAPCLLFYYFTTLPLPNAQWITKLRF